MYRDSFVTVIIPALNEAETIGSVIKALPDSIDLIIVGDNGSTDGTREAAEREGARVFDEPERGYGAACLRAIKEAPPSTDILLFIDGDMSDFPEEATSLLDPIIDGNADLVIGSRTTTAEARKALTPVAVFGNWLSTGLIKLFWGARYTDLGPFRAIRFTAYRSLNMRDRDFGWTVEMQIKAAKKKLRGVEVPVSYRKRRSGKSKVSGTISGSCKAGAKILYLIGREALLD